jgi:hypothetical protein
MNKLRALHVQGAPWLLTGMLSCAALGAEVPSKQERPMRQTCRSHCIQLAHLAMRATAAADTHGVL